MPRAEAAAPMRILFVHPAAAMSIADVARGYRAALERQGHRVADYHLGRRFAYHRKAIPPEIQEAEPHTLSRMASETIICEALYHRAELVVVVSGLNLSPVATWLLGEVRIPVAVILTESPYDDEDQARWVDMQHLDGRTRIHVFTNDQHSATKYGWGYLPPAFDPVYHHPAAFEPENECDVLMVGTGWPERQAMLEAVDWTGIDLRLFGIWPGIQPDSPLAPYYRPFIVNNDRIAGMYCSAKVNINFHRRSSDAITPGPRVYELAACGAFQISDPRPGLYDLFGPSVPTFDGATQLQSQLRTYLDPEFGASRRRFAADHARACVQGETFDNRAAELVARLRAPVRIPTRSGPTTTATIM